MNHMHDARLSCTPSVSKLALSPALISREALRDGSLTALTH